MRRIASLTELKTAGTGKCVEWVGHAEVLVLFTTPRGTGFLGHVPASILETDSAIIRSMPTYGRSRVYYTRSHRDAPPEG